MITVYFDRNVFADICEFRNNVTQKEIDVLQEAVKAKQISIPLSSALLAETTVMLQKSNSEFLKHIKTVFSLISRNRMVKRNDDLLRDDCISFAYLAPFQRTVPLLDEGKKFINSPKADSRFLKVALNHPPAMKKAVENINLALSSYRQDIENAGLRTPVDFIDVWNEQSIKLVKRLLSELPAKERKLCERHGVEKMLDIRSLRLYTVYYCWIRFSGLSGIQGNPRKLTSNDFMDFIHTIEASAAEILVTQENKTKANKLPFIINQMNFKNFKVMNLEEFIQHLQTL